MPDLLDTIHLTENESQLFNMLEACAEELRTENPHLKDLTLRVAGGWVRDKLLGKDSDDIDIALTDLKGEQFAHAAQLYLQKSGVKPGHLATIQVNPEKSKHLETANVSMFGYSIDFVHLRTETYGEDSRNPDIQIGTPLEDSLRRDITINALFWNLHTREVEDFTGNGLEDLRVGRIRTPLPPHQTFIDDPLRVLRVIRFATRFGYNVDPEIVECIGHDEIKSVFDRKLSRERIGVEVTKMLKGPDPVRALRMIIEYGYYDLVFAVPAAAQEQTGTVSSAGVLDLAGMIEQFLKSMTFQSFYENSALPPFTMDHRRLLYLTAALAPYKDIQFQPPLAKNKPDLPSPYPLVRDVGIHSLKLSLHDADIVETLLGNIGVVREAVGKGVGVGRKDLGLLVRHLGQRPLFDSWPLALLYTWITDATEHAVSGNSHIPTLDIDNRPEASLIDPKYLEYFTGIQTQNLEFAHTFRSTLNGKEIADILGVKPGPVIGEYIAALIEEELEHPGMEREECVKFIENLRDSGKIQLPLPPAKKVKKAPTPAKPKKAGSS